MPGVFGSTGSGIGTLGAKADTCDSLAVGPGAQAVNHSLAMGPSVCTTTEYSIAIGSCDIENVRIGCWDLQYLQNCISALEQRVDIAYPPVVWYA